MDGLGLAGETPMMGPPPKVCPERFVPDDEEESPGEPAPAVELVSAGVPALTEEPNALPAGVAPARPGPARPSGCPKKPMAIGALFCPNRMGFQSSLPVIGSVYRLRKNLIRLVLTRASTLVG